MNLSLSIGIGRGAKTLREAQDMAVQALERMTGRKVKERYIYSFTLGEAFSL